jgi:hypothetical protein
MEHVAFVINPVSEKSDGYRQFAVVTDLLQERGPGRDDSDSDGS